MSKPADSSVFLYIHHPSTIICHHGRLKTEEVLPLLMSCLGKILAGMVSRGLPRRLGFGVSFSHDGRVFVVVLYNCCINGRVMYLNACL